MGVTDHRSLAFAAASAAALAYAAPAPGSRSAAYRPPYGVFNLAALVVAWGHAWRPLLWTRWGRDWEAQATPESIAYLLTDGLDRGSVLLLHDADDYSAPGSWRNT